MQKGKNFILPGYKPLHFSIRDSIGLNNNGVASSYHLKINSSTIPTLKDMLNVRPKQAINNFDEILDGSVNKNFPETLIKVNKINSPLNPWMTPGLLTS